MRHLPQVTLLLLATLLAGCGSSPMGTDPNPPGSILPKLTGNWQIQAGPAPGSAITSTGVALLGALTGSGTHVTGNLRLINPASPGSCTYPLQALLFSGAVDRANQLTLTSQPFSGSIATLRLTLNPETRLPSHGDLQIDGGSCSVPSTPAIGALLATSD